MIAWNHPGVDATGMVARCEKIAGACEQVTVSGSTYTSLFAILRSLIGYLFYL